MFAWDNAGPALAAFNDVSNTFQNTNLRSHWLSRICDLIGCQEVAYLRIIIICTRHIDKKDKHRAPGLPMGTHVIKNVF